MRVEHFDSLTGVRINCQVERVAQPLIKQFTVKLRLVNLKSTNAYWIFKTTRITSKYLNTFIEKDIKEKYEHNIKTWKYIKIGRN